MWKGNNRSILACTKPRLFSQLNSQGTKAHHLSLIKKKILQVAISLLTKIWIHKEKNVDYLFILLRNNFVVIIIPPHKMFYKGNHLFFIQLTQFLSFFLFLSFFFKRRNEFNPFSTVWTWKSPNDGKYSRTKWFSLLWRRKVEIVIAYIWLGIKILHQNAITKRSTISLSPTLAF